MERSMKLMHLTPALLAAVTTLSAVDFTPTVSVKKLEKFSIPIITFHHGDKPASFKPPLGWKTEGGADALTLTPADMRESSMKFLSLQWSAEKGAKLADPSAEAKWALGYIPASATDAEIVATNESPYMLGVQPTREWVIKYRVDGIVHETSVSRCDISAQERIVVLLSAPAQNFEKLRQDGISSLFSWEWL
jgi:hypothetical protein